MSARASLGLAAAAALATGCATLGQLPGGLGDVGRSGERIGANLVRAAASGELTKTASFTMEQEHHLGKTVAASVVSRTGGAALPPEHPAAVYLRTVGTVVALAAAELRDADSRPYPLKGYRFIPVDSPMVNAVGTPGGFVVVTTGLLRSVRSEDELAAVLAHEVAHVQLGHTMAPVEAARKQEQLTGVLLDGTSDVVHAFFGKVVSTGTDLVLDRGFGKKNETAADAFAVRILAEAGYDPSALATFLGRLEGGAARGGFFSRHPPPRERVTALGRAVAAPVPAAAAPRARADRFARAVSSIGI